VKKTFVYDTSSNWFSPRKSQILRYAFDQNVLVLLQIARKKVENEKLNKILNMH